MMGAIDFKSKTFWTGIVAAATAVGSYFTGEVELLPAILAVLVALQMIFVRHTVVKAKPE